ncbi:MAG: peptide chain release factor N(5)-glutamine methyltransferase, partial [Prevotella sp.]|nr:peptide chain release factor N(5)-glutamine methyltransferase [Prevotella sp.]
EKQEMERNVLDYEPSIALFVPNEDPLLYYRAIAKFAQNALYDGGQLLFEINPLYANELEELMKSMNYKEIKIVNDTFGKKRFLTCQKQ